MKLMLNEVELQDIVLAFLETTGFSLKDKEVDYNFTDGECHLDIGGHINPVDDKPVQKRKLKAKAEVKEVVNVKEKQAQEKEEEEEENTFVKESVDKLFLDNSEEETQEEPEKTNEEEEEEEEEGISKGNTNAFNLFG